MSIRKIVSPLIPRPVKRAVSLARLMRQIAKYDPRLLEQIPSLAQGLQCGRGEWPSSTAVDQSEPTTNFLREYFDSHTEGRGLWKWLHYFDIYDRYFSKFRGKEVHVLEIGIFSGGSLAMWKEYFGPKCHIYGVDIEPTCKKYEDDSVTVFIGDQEDRGFWREFKKTVPDLDIIIDDGGHAPGQQIVTLEELLNHLRPGGVYLCEDITDVLNPFTSYINGLIYNLNSVEFIEEHRGIDEMERRAAGKTTEFQSVIRAVHSYPFVTVIEKWDKPLAELVAPKHGTIWEPLPE